MKTVTIFDCEFLTAEGAMSRLWCGVHDPDPILVQIGAIKLGLTEGLPIVAEMLEYVLPFDRLGNKAVLDPFFTSLTGIREKDLSEKGKSFRNVCQQFEAFVGEDKIWSWGKDELWALGINCFLNGYAMTLKPNQFGNAASLFLAAGIPEAELLKIRSSTLAQYYGICTKDLKAHDALDDVRSIVRALQYCCEQKKIDFSLLV
jgi:hypothetical protein